MASSTDVFQIDYTQMIMSAVEQLYPGGVNKTTISTYIESNYPDLPPAHSSLLSTALDKLCQSGQLVFSNNNFSISDPNAPPKRGRGRPPKLNPNPTAAAAATPYTGPPRPRGRPPKVVDPSSPPPQSKLKTSSGRPRGRPKKNFDGGDSAPAPVSVPVSVAAPVAGVKRGRGRPPKGG